MHVPAGAVPKDGPTAGVTMVTALVSLATGRPVRSEVGMTGEVTLNGRVLPIGGVKQKLLAAQRAGLTEVFLPQRNEADLDDVPADVLEADVTVHLVGDVLDVGRAVRSARAHRRPASRQLSRRPAREQRSGGQAGPAIGAEPRAGSRGRRRRGACGVNASGSSPAVSATTAPS